MEPLMPEDREGKLAVLGLEVIRRAERRLSECCEFLLRTAVDQLEFMQGLLDLDRVQNRIAGYAERRESAKELPSGSGWVLREVFLRGQIARGEVARVINASPRTAQTVTRRLLQEGLLVSDSPKGLVRLGCSADASSHFFPNLFPAGTE